MMRSALTRYCLAVLAIACVSGLPVRSVAQTEVAECASCSRISPHRDGHLRSLVLSMHNQERARWHAPDLKWNNRLAEAAYDHANMLAREGVLRHGQQKAGEPAFGENLWIGSRGGYSYADMMKSFLDEGRVYVARAVPDISSTGRWSDAGHYSQMIWRSTSSVGCAVASGRDFDVLVCRYDPPGNVWGMRADDGDQREARIRIASNGQVIPAR